MYEIRDKAGRVKAKIWLAVHEIEPTALQQIYNMLALPIIHPWLAIMPDVHMGIGATIGSVLPCDSALIPSAVGVDIGCGMCSVKTSLRRSDIAIHLPEIHSGIRQRIPMGFEHRRSGQMDDVKQFASQQILEWLRDYDKNSGIADQLGTLGGGNHFIELQVDPDDFVWIMLHSGSRNIGKTLAETHMKVAKQWCKSRGEKPPSNLDFIEESSSEGKRYIDDMTFAMEFARQNRFVMMEAIKEVIADSVHDVSFAPVINIHHNYAAREEHYGKSVWVHRKGATRVKTDITGIIPGSMAESSYIVHGTDNAESLNSCSHGAGRKMSRRAAKESINLERLRTQMMGIYSESLSQSVLDEAPDAYKNIEEVMANQKDLVTIDTRLRPILNIKA
jgi:tRNA-splicing ligase RtcB (3'-phosphate/5'-hydroxy nucleic acid ligase)